MVVTPCHRTWADAWRQGVWELCMDKIPYKLNLSIERELRCISLLWSSQQPQTDLMIEYSLCSLPAAQGAALGGVEPRQRGSSCC